MGKLSGMQVGRVDGVDKPAIRKRFVLVKSDEAQTVEKDYAGAARSAIEAIAKEGVSFSEETVEVLRALVEMLELDVEFAAKSEDDGETDESDADEDADADADAAELDEDGNPIEKSVEKLAYTPDEVEALIAAALKKAGLTVDVSKNDDGTPESRASRITVSKQAKGQGGDAAEPKVVRKGEGLYSNIVNGEASQPFSA